MERNDPEVLNATSSDQSAAEREKLVPLSTLESWTVSDGEPDIRGWELRTVSGRQLGCVSDLLIDEQAGEVVFIDVDLSGSDRHTFVPARVVQIDRTRRVVLMDSADLPATNSARAARRAFDRRLGTGTVRYPRTDREVPVERQALLDDAPRPARDPNDAERRKLERRRIDRMSTGF
jgi:hypothetical protein